MTPQYDAFSMSTTMSSDCDRSFDNRTYFQEREPTSEMTDDSRLMTMRFVYTFRAKPEQISVSSWMPLPAKHCHVSLVLLYGDGQDTCEGRSSLRFPGPQAMGSCNLQTASRAMLHT